MKKIGKIAARILVLALVVCTVMSCMTACGKTVSVTINDAGTTTIVEAKASDTVGDILAEAGITLGEKDVAEPAVDKEIGDTATILVKRYATVTVKFEDNEKEVSLAGGKVSDAVREAGYALDNEYMPDVDNDTYLKDGMVITLKKAISVTLIADGNTNSVKTFAATVADFIDEQKLTLDNDDEVTPAVDEAIKEGSKIVIKRVEYKEETKKETVPYTTQTKEDSSLAAGTQKVQQAGVNGEKEVTYKIKYVDGKEDSKEVLSEKVLTESVPEIVLVNSQSQTNNDSGNTDSGNSDGGRQVVSKVPVYDCDGSGHGYYEITYSDGTVEYEVF